MAYSATGFGALAFSDPVTGGIYNRSAPANASAYPGCVTDAERAIAHASCKPGRPLSGLGATASRYDGAPPCWVETLPTCPPPVNWAQAVAYATAVKAAQDLAARVRTTQMLEPPKRAPAPLPQMLQPPPRPAAKPPAPLPQMLQPPSRAAAPLPQMLEPPKKPGIIAQLFQPLEPPKRAAPSVTETPPSMQPSDDGGKPMVTTAPPVQAGTSTGGMLAVAAAVVVGGWWFFGRKKKQAA